jgi:hypothetical protein
MKTLQPPVSSTRRLPDRGAALASVRVFAANEREPLYRDIAQHPTGTIVAANDDLLVESFFSEPLTTYTTGWRDPSNLQGALDFVAPPVPVGRRFEFAQANNAEEFFSEVDDVRAVGADFKRVEYSSNKALGLTLNKGLTLRVDREQVASNPEWQRQAVDRLMRRLLRNEYRRAITIITAAATSTNKTWDGTTAQDPDQDVITDLIAGGDISGVPANRVLYSANSWNARGLAYRLQVNRAGTLQLATMTPQEVAGTLGVDQVMVNRSRYQATATTKTQIVGSQVIEFFAEDGLTQDDPSNIKRFVSPTDAGGRFAVYVQPMGAKLWDVTVEHYSNIIVTSTLGLRALNITS